MSIYEELHLNPESHSPPFYQNSEVRGKILEYSQGLLGRIVTLLKESAINIFTKKLERITLELLKETAIELKYYMDSKFEENDENE